MPLLGLIHLHHWHYTVVSCLTLFLPLGTKRTMLGLTALSVGTMTATGHHTGEDGRCHTIQQNEMPTGARPTMDARTLALVLLQAGATTLD